MTGTLAGAVRPAAVFPKIRAAGEGLRLGWSQIVPHLAGHWPAIIASCIATIVYVAARLLEPWFLKVLVDHVFRGETFDGPFGTVIEPGALLILLVAAMFCTALLSAVARYVQRTRSARIGQVAGHGLRTRLFAQMLSLSPRFHARKRPGDLVVRLMSDVRILTQAFIAIPIRTFEEGLLLFGMFAMMLFIDWRLTMLAALALPLAILLLKRHRGPLREAVRQQRKRESQLAATASEALSAIEVIQTYGRERSEVARFGKAAKKDLGSGLKSARIEGRLYWAMEVAVGLATAGLIGVAVRMIAEGSLTAGELIVFGYYLTMFYQPVRRLSRTFKRVTRAGTAAERINDILARRPEIEPARGIVDGAGIIGDIRFKGVGVALDERPILQGVDLHIGAGEAVTLLGPSGAGKSTLVSLIARLIDPDEGSVLIDGIDLRERSVTALRRQVAFAPQDPLLFSGTLAENVTLGLPHGTAEMEMDAAAQAAGVAPMIDAFPKRWDTRISEGGTSLSGGQKRAVSLVRAMLRDASIVVFDEPTTGLDLDNATRVTGAIADLAGRKTVIVITHDLAQVVPNSRVLTLADGRVFTSSAGVHV